MKVFLTAALFLFFVQSMNAQNMYKPSDYEINNSPDWVKKMYVDNPNVFEVDSLYKLYYKTHEFIKTYHTQYYKKWRKQILYNIDDFGNLIENTEQVPKKENTYHSNAKLTSWSLIGPIQNTRTNNQGSGQANIYCIDQCKSQSNVLYCGTEPGEVYKSIDGGNTWFCTSLNEDFGYGVSAIEVDPLNPDIVIAGSNTGIFLSSDGGQTWTTTLAVSNFGVNEILINSENTQIVIVASDRGLYRSVDGGNTWNQLYNHKTYDVKENHANSSILYCLKGNQVEKKCEFFKSTDYGLTWSIQSVGWYNSTNSLRNDGGGRLALTPANPNRIYAYLIGESKPNDHGYIGIYKSDDGGESWSLPSGQVGGPYSASHPNLAIGSPDWIYHQGFYNCAILCSETNPEEILVGGLNLWKSTNGGESYQSLSGYIGGPLDLHVDNQDFRSVNGNYWITTDGGIYHSTNFLNTQPNFKMNGINGSEYWGFGTGWNEDVLVGGLYHNGNLAHHENYEEGLFLELGGGEDPTGYVNPGNNKKTYFSDVQGVILPNVVNDPIQYFGINMTPNQSYWVAESSEMEFHPNCYNIAYIGKENALWKSTDGGISYNLVKRFGTNVNDEVKYIEISSSNPSVIYLNQQPVSGNSGKLWKTTDGGENWQQLQLPNGNSRRILIAINPKDENNLWIAYPGGANGNKVYQSSNGGISWTNITTNVLNNETIQALIHIAGTEGGLYVGTNKSVYYRNSNTSWQLDNLNLPKFINSNILRPFYRDGKIRLASYGKGIWEGNLNEDNILPIARIMVNKLEQVVLCDVDSFYFQDYSFLNHTNATWEWNFPTGIPSHSTEKKISVFFQNEGNHLAILKITDQYGNIDLDTVVVSVTNFDAPNSIQENFQNEFPPLGWFQQSEVNASSWSVSNEVGGYGNSTKSAFFDNYNNDSQGAKSDLIFSLDLKNLPDSYFTFDVAYTPYGGTYVDTLEILYSLDCGETFSRIYYKGGANLSTAPNSQDFFVPSSNQWRTDSINLEGLIGNEDVMIAFRNIGYYGNALYIDNVNISNTLGKTFLMPSKELKVYPTVLCTNEFINIESNQHVKSIEIVDSNGKRILKEHKLHSNKVYLPNSTKSGIYFMNITTENTIWNEKLIVIE
jgi:photosystem II stability/assembly factor-like uncharacterized protein